VSIRVGNTSRRHRFPNPPENLNVVGKPLPSLPEVGIPRFTGKAQYASRVWFRDLLYVKLLTSPHPRARIKNIDTAAAEKMPGVAHVVTHKNVPRRAGRTASRLDPLPQELNRQGEVVAIVAAETEDLAQDALDAIQVEYEVLPFASTLKDATAPNAPLLGQGNTNLVRPPTAPKEFPDVTWASQQGDVEKGFAEADIVKEFTYDGSGGFCGSRQCRAAQVQRDEDRYGQGSPGLRPGGAECHGIRAVLPPQLGEGTCRLRSSARPTLS
jgi:hypothetical protein